MSNLLGSIFVDDGEPDEADEPIASPQLDDAAIAGLDASHSALVHLLASNEDWRRGDFERVARRLGLMPDGAVDTINEAILDACGEPFLEGDDPLRVNVLAIRELMA